MAVPIPSKVYLDTSVIVAAISSGDPHYLACSTYCTALANNNSTIYFSQLLRLEYAQFIRKLATDATYALPSSIYQQYQLQDFGTNMMIRHQWMRFLMSQFDALVATFYTVRELPVGKEIPPHSIQLMSLHGLESYDAAHMATALREKVPDLATTDRKFSRAASGLRIHLIH